MDLFGRFRKLDSSLQRGLDNGFARVFGGEVVPAEIDELLKQEAEDALMEDSAGTLFAPSYYSVHVSDRDHAALLEDRPDLADSLRDRLARFLRNEGWTTDEVVAVDIVRDSALHTGQLKAVSHFRRPVAPGGADGADSADSADGAAGRYAAGGGAGADRRDPAPASDGQVEWPHRAGPARRSVAGKEYDAPSPEHEPDHAAGQRPDTGGARDGSAADVAGAAGASAALGSVVNPGHGTGLSRDGRDDRSAAPADGWPEPRRDSEPQERPDPLPHPGETAYPQARTPEDVNPDDTTTEPPYTPHSYPGTEVVTHSNMPDPVSGGAGRRGHGAHAEDGADGADRDPAVPEAQVSLHLRDGSDRTLVLRHGSNLVGRGNAVDLRIPDTGVSRQHADITWDGYDAVLTDLQSTNGTTVNEIPVDNWLLADGDVIAMGHSEIEVRFS